MRDHDLDAAREIAARVAEAGGRVYFVGGCVRDQLLQRETKDIDIEVHGVSVEKLAEILDSIGERTEMGASFGIFGLKHTGLDIALPRRERSTGCGHKDFAVSVDPFIGPEKAAERRDFTVNALMQDVLTGEILDFFGGREDLARRRIRHVNDRTFAEDPLRVFRAAQFAARFGFAVAEETTRICSTIDVSALAGERVIGELEKALLRAEHPSVFFEELRKMNRLSFWFPEAQAMLGIAQNVQHHPEGDVWTHTMQVLDEAAALRERAAQPLWLMLSALCHDFGKAAVTEEQNGKIHAYGHERESLPLTRRFLSRLTREVKLREYVLNMVELHMKPNMMAENCSEVKAFMKLFDRAVCPEDLLLLAKADHMGRVAGGQNPETARAALEASYAGTEKKLRDLLAVYRQRMAEPYLMGKDLIEAGLQPGPVFTQALDYAHKLRLAGLPKEEQLRQTLGFVRSLKTEPKNPS